jgi:hypothetical protein
VTATAGYVTNLRRNNFMDIELEKKIELLEWQRDNALRLRCPLVAKKYQRMIDELARKSRNYETKERFD